MRTWPALLLLLACACAGARAEAPACAAESLPQARLAGQGEYTWFGLDIYAAQLWVGPQGYRPEAPFALELRYERALRGRKIAEASAEQMERSGAGTPAQRAAWLRAMLGLFPDVQAGTRICGVNLGEGGARFYVDDRPLGVLADPAFARAFFGIWLAPTSTARTLRAQLLKNAAAP